jgi:hypothetical protein
VTDNRQNPGGDGQGGNGQQGGQGGNPGGQGAQGGGAAGGSGGGGAGGGGGGGGSGAGAWIDTMPAIKANADLVGQLSTYESPEAALVDLSTKGWGPKWREQAAGNDQAKLAELRRYQTPGAALTALFDAKERIRTGLLAKPLPANPNEQEVAEYRAAQGIPEKPEGYAENLPQGIVLGEEDKPVFNSLMAELHKIHTPPRVAHAILGWYNKHVESEAGEIAAQDGRDKEEVQTALRQEWGNDYKANVNINANYLQSLPPDVRDAITNARDLDGRALVNHAGVLKWLTEVARNNADVSTLMLDTGGNAMKSINQRIAEIEGILRTDRQKYNKDTAMQKEYEDLLEKRERINQANKARSAA